MIIRYTLEEREKFREVFPGGEREVYELMEKVLERLTAVEELRLYVQCSQIFGENLNAEHNIVRAFTLEETKALAKMILEI